MNRGRAFSLVELMMAIAVVMVLASIAIPLAAQAQARSRQAELETVVDGVRTAQVGYNASTDLWFVSSAWAPTSSPSKTLRAWTGYSTIGFVPDGLVRGSYRITTSTDANPKLCTPQLAWSGTCTDSACMVGMGDMDADGKRSCVYQTDKQSSAWINQTYL